MARFVMWYPWDFFMISHAILELFFQVKIWTSERPQYGVVRHMSFMGSLG